MEGIAERFLGGQARLGPVGLVRESGVSNKGVIGSDGFKVTLYMERRLHLLQEPESGRSVRGLLM